MFIAGNEAIRKCGEERRIGQEDRIIFYFFALIIYNSATFCVNAHRVFYLREIRFEGLRRKPGRARYIKFFFTPTSMRSKAVNPTRVLVVLIVAHFVSNKK